MDRLTIAVHCANFMPAIENRNAVRDPLADLHSVLDLIKAI
jgi:hypothetical protein